MRKVPFFVAWLFASMFAVSHAIDLRVSSDSVYRFADPVFPFMTGRWVYSIFTFLLFFYSVCCLSVICGYAKAEGLTVAFSCLVSASIVVYQLSLHALGFFDCKCLGRMGVLLHLTKPQETTLRNAAWLSLALPFITYSVKKVAGCRPLRRVSPALVLAFGCCLAMNHRLVGQTILIEGSYHSQRQHPGLGSALTNSDAAGNFSVQLSTNAYRFCLTNNLDGSDCGAYYDGTNICYFENINEQGKRQLVGGRGTALVNSGNWWIDGDVNRMPPYLLWLMFGISQDDFNRTDVNDRPLPWDQPRFRPTAFGYAWKCDWLEQQRFLKSAEALRDKSLDFPRLVEEFTRPKFYLPETADLQQAALVRLQDLRKTVPDKLLAGSYSCSSFSNYNGTIIPLKSELKAYAHHGLSGGTNRAFPGTVATAAVTKLSTSASPVDFHLYAPANQPIEVGDARLAEYANRRYFPGLLYRIGSGETIRGADHPDVLVAKHLALEQGPIIVWNGVTSLHTIIWGAFIMLLVISAGWLRGQIRQYRTNK